MSMRCVYERMLSRSGPNLNLSIEIICQCGVFMYVCYRDPVQTLIRALKLDVNAMCLCMYIVFNQSSLSFSNITQNVSDQQGLI